MARLVTPADPVVTLLRRWACDRATIPVGPSVPPVRLDTVDGFPTAVVAYATDIPELTRWGRPCLYGPGSIHVAHTDGEYVEVAELRGAVEQYERLARGAIDAVLR
jgi:acetylornithine deacetylase